MKTLFKLLPLLLLAGITGLAHADHRHSRVGVYFGVGVPAPWYYSPPPYYYYPPYYYEPRVVVVPPPQPTVYVERTPEPPAPVVTAPAPAPAQHYWYYCRPAKAYYPYVKECPEAWQPVAPQPASSR